MASSLARDGDTAAEVKQAEWVLGAVDPQLLPGPSPVPQALVALKPFLFPPELEGRFGKVFDGGMLCSCALEH